MEFPDFPSSKRLGHGAEINRCLVSGLPFRKLRRTREMDERKWNRLGCRGRLWIPVSHVSMFSFEFRSCPMVSMKEFGDELAMWI